MGSPRAIGESIAVDCSGGHPLARESCWGQRDLSINDHKLNIGSSEAWLLQRARASVAFWSVQSVHRRHGPLPTGRPLENMFCEDNHKQNSIQR